MSLINLRALIYKFGDGWRTVSKSGANHHRHATYTRANRTLTKTDTATALGPTVAECWVPHTTFATYQPSVHTGFAGGSGSIYLPKYLIELAISSPHGKGFVETRQRHEAVYACNLLQLTLGVDLIRVGFAAGYLANRQQFTITSAANGTYLASEWNRRHERFATDWARNLEAMRIGLVAFLRGNNCLTGTGLRRHRERIDVEKSGDQGWRDAKQMQKNKGKMRKTRTPR